jgi:hypothetical protein
MQAVCATAKLSSATAGPAQTEEIVLCPAT